MQDPFSKKPEAQKSGIILCAARKLAICIGAGCAGSASLCAVPPSVKTSPEPQTEAALRHRMTGFYDCYVNGEFRKAEEFVAPDSRDAYFNAAKERMRAYRIAQITFSNGGRAAKAVLLVNAQTVIAGQIMPADIPMSSDWKYIDGEWFWSAPSAQVPRLPMGPTMGDASPAALPPSSRPLPKTLAGLGVPILDKPVLTVSPGSNKKDSAHLVNLSRQALTFQIDCPAIPGVQLKPLQAELPPGGSVEITAEATASNAPAAKREGRILVHTANGDPTVTMQFYVQVVTE